MRKTFESLRERSGIISTDPFVSGDIACPSSDFCYPNNHLTSRELNICNPSKD